MTAPSPSRPPDSAGHSTDPSAAPRDEPVRARLSLTQVVASGLAAVSATVLLSFFGAAGTIIGAGLASVMTVIGNFLYTRSIEKTQEQLKPVVNQIVARGVVPAGVRSRTTLTIPLDGARDSAGKDPVTTTTPLGSVPHEDSSTETLPTATLPAAGGPVEDATTDDATADATAEDAQPTNAWLRLVERHGKAKVFTVSALALFVVVMGVVLIVELVIGKPLSDAVRGQEGSGTSISRGTTDTPDDSTTVPTSPTDDPANVPGDDSDRGTDGDSKTGTTDDPAQQPTDGSTPTEGTDGSGDTSTGGTDGGTTDGSTGDTGDGSGGTGDTGGTDGNTGDDTTGGSDGSGEDPGGTGADRGSGTDTDSGRDTGSGSSDGSAEQNLEPSSGDTAPTP